MSANIPPPHTTTTSTSSTAAAAASPLSLSPDFLWRRWAPIHIDSPFSQRASMPVLQPLPSNHPPGTHIFVRSSEINTPGACSCTRSTRRAHRSGPGGGGRVRMRAPTNGRRVPHHTEQRPPAAPPPPPPPARQLRGTMCCLESENAF